MSPEMFRFCCKIELTLSEKQLKGSVSNDTMTWRENPANGDFAGEPQSF